MTNYNERLDEVLASHGAEEGEFTESLKQAITSLFKEMVAEAKPKTNEFKANPDYSDMLNRYNSAHNDGYNMAVEIYHTNLLKALEDKK